MIRICLVDDQALVRSGIRVLLDTFDDLDVVGEASDGTSGIQMVATLKPDVLLLDVRMPGPGGIEVLAALQTANALPPTLLLTTFEDDVALIAGLRAGAKGYLLKGVTPETLVEAIRQVAAGGSYLFSPSAPVPPGFGQKDAARGEDIEPVEELTDRERDVLKLMSSGISNQEIAEALRIGNGTVRNHISSIFAKLGVNDRTKAVLYALRKRLV